MFDTSKIRCKALCVVLAVVVATFGVLPKTGTSLDDFTQPEKAEAIPIVAVPIAATLFALAGVAVVGSTQSEYDLNLEKCWNDFVSWSGTTSDALAAELSNAVGDDGMIALRLLTTGCLSDLATWAESLDMSDVPNSKDIPLTSVAIDDRVFAFNVTDADLHSDFDKISYPSAFARYPVDKSFNPDSTATEVVVEVSSDGYLYILYNEADGGFTVTFLQAIGSIYSNGRIVGHFPDEALPSRRWMGLSSNSKLNRVADLSAVTVKSGIKIRFEDAQSSTNKCVLDLSKGEWIEGSGRYVKGGAALDGAVAGALVGSVLAGGRTWGDFADRVKVWSPTADQLAAGYEYTDVMEGTGALENSSGGEGEGGGSDTGSLLNKILAALTLLLGLDRIPAILDGISGALTGWWDALMAWCADVWAWMQSLDMAQWLSDVWDWLRDVDLVSLLSPLSLLWEWLSSLGLAGWLADVWTWIQSLGLVQWLAQVWDWIATLDIAGEFAGLLAAIQALPDFFKPRDDFDWSKFKDVDAYMIFPICLPWDLYDMVSLLSSSAKAPAFEFPLVTPVGDYSLSVDLSDYDSVASILRTVELLLFGIGLIFVTKKMMG